MSEYFTKKELQCPCCKANAFNPETRLRLNKLRRALGFPIIPNSAFRCRDYNLANGWTLTHETGQAMDINIRGKKALELVAKAIELGFTGIGIKQHGPHRFIHVDDLPEAVGRPRPWIWSY